MTFVADSGTARGSEAPISFELSPLDRALEPLARLGEAIRAEIALSLAPVFRDLEAARRRVEMLEARVRELESASSAQASHNEPASNAVRWAVGRKAQREAKPPPTRNVGPAESAARDADMVATEATVPAVIPAADRGAGINAGPSTSAEGAASKAEAACTAVAEAPPRLPKRKRRPRANAVVDLSPAVLANDATTASDASAVTGTDPTVATNRAWPNGRGTPEGPCQEAARDPTAIRLPAILEAGARDLIALGRYPDLQSLINEAVYRLLEADHPGG